MYTQRLRDTWFLELFCDEKCVRILTHSKLRIHLFNFILLGRTSVSKCELLETKFTHWCESRILPKGKSQLQRLKLADIAKQSHANEASYLQLGFRACLGYEQTERQRQRCH